MLIKSRQKPTGQDSVYQLNRTESLSIKWNLSRIVYRYAGVGEIFKTQDQLSVSSFLINTEKKSSGMCRGEPAHQ